MNEPKSICIGVISAGQMQVETCFCLIQALSKVEVPITMALVKGCYLHRNRNEMIAQAIKTGATHVMSIDTDMVFNQDAIKRLIEADKDIIGANYNKRELPLNPIVKDGPTDAPFQTEFTPGGFALINLEVFKKLPEPWFFYDPSQGLNDDDKYFCTKAKEAGFEVWCDPTIKIGHIGTFIY